MVQEKLKILEGVRRAPEIIFDVEWKAKKAIREISRYKASISNGLLVTALTLHI